MTKNKNHPQWTLNADVGEGCDDALIMPCLDCANIACAAHAGDEKSIREALILAKRYKVNIGAHPGYPDKVHFGRQSLSLSGEELYTTLTTQIRLLIGLATKYGLSVSYVKPHGALNHDMLKKIDIFKVICQSVSDINPMLALLVPTNAKQNQQIRIAKYYGLEICWEVFADRRYEPSGLLRSRQFSDALYSQPQDIIDQINGIRQRGEIIAIDGQLLDVSHAQTICIHGDHTPSVTAIQSIHQPSNQRS